MKVNCAALSESLLESELFGHEKGAFTGATATARAASSRPTAARSSSTRSATSRRAFQAKLLRVLQEREFERVGGNANAARSTCASSPRPTATSRRWWRKGDFRADLYYRINVVSIMLPPLRERREDIPLLAEHFLDAVQRARTNAASVIPERRCAGCSRCYWPATCASSRTASSARATMDRGDGHHRAGCTLSAGPVPVLPRSGSMTTARVSMPWSTRRWRMRRSGGGSDTADELLPDATLEGLEPRDRLVRAMERCGWVQAKAARLLNLTPRQLGYALKKHNIEVKRL